MICRGMIFEVRAKVCFRNKLGSAMVQTVENGILAWGPRNVHIGVVVSTEPLLDTDNSSLSI